jgi:hypothetical protein
MNKINLSDYYLDFKTLNGLDEKAYKEVFSMYRDMLHYAETAQTVASIGFLNTLKANGFVKNLTQENRETKITELIDENV